MFIHRALLVSVASSLVTGLLTPDSACAQQAAAGRRPNIVFIYGDDHAERALGAYGSPLIETPHLDRLAADGVRFTSSFVANSICGPARATILTGLHSHANGKTTNQAGFRDDLPSFAALLQGAGYRTGIVGKWHLPSDPRGFDHWAILRGGYYNPSLVTAEGPSAQTGYTTDVITDEALRWIAADRGEGADEQQPFFAWISHTSSHRTWMPGKYQRYIKDYLRCVAGIDDSVGAARARSADELGSPTNTIVVYTSDQGFFLGEHGWYDKRWMYEPSLRTPLIVAGRA